MKEGRSTKILIQIVEMNFLIIFLFFLLSCKFFSATTDTIYSEKQSPIIINRFIRRSSLDLKHSLKFLDPINSWEEFPPTETQDLHPETYVSPKSSNGKNEMTLALMPSTNPPLECTFPTNAVAKKGKDFFSPPSKTQRLALKDSSFLEQTKNEPCVSKQDFGRQGNDEPQKIKSSLLLPSLSIENSDREAKSEPTSEIFQKDSPSKTRNKNKPTLPLSPMSEERADSTEPLKDSKIVFIQQSSEERKKGDVLIFQEPYSEIQKTANLSIESLQKSSLVDLRPSKIGLQFHQKDQKSSFKKQLFPDNTIEAAFKTYKEIINDKHTDRKDELEMQMLNAFIRDRLQIVFLLLRSVPELAAAMHSITDFAHDNREADGGFFHHRKFSSLAYLRALLNVKDKSDKLTLACMTLHKKLQFTSRFRYSLEGPYKGVSFAFVWREVLFELSANKKLKRHLPELNIVKVSTVSNIRKLFESEKNPEKLLSAYLITLPYSSDNDKKIPRQVGFGANKEIVYTITQELFMDADNHLISKLINQTENFRQKTLQPNVTHYLLYSRSILKHQQTLNNNHTRVI